MAKKQKHETPEEATNSSEMTEELEVEEVAEILEEVEETEEERLKRLLAEADERYLRLAAEYDNYRKRTSKEKDGIYPQAKADTVAKFLPIYDSFIRGLEFDPTTEDFAKGIGLISQNFGETLTSLGVEPVGKVGEPFSPDLHNAVMHVDDPELGENVISLVLQEGYRIGDRIVRHAVVQTAN